MTRYSPVALPLVTSRSADARPTRPAGIRHICCDRLGGRRPAGDGHWPNSILAALRSRLARCADRRGHGAGSHDRGIRRGRWPDVWTARNRARGDGIVVVTGRSAELPADLRGRVDTRRSIPRCGPGRGGTITHTPPFGRPLSDYSWRLTFAGMTRAGSSCSAERRTGENGEGADRR